MTEADTGALLATSQGVMTAFLHKLHPPGSNSNADNTGNVKDK